MCVNWYSHCGDCGDSQTLKMEVAWWYSELSSEEHSKELRSGFWGSICTSVFTSTRFIVTRIWQKPKCSGTARKLRSICPCYSVTKGGTMSSEAAWDEPGEYYSNISRKQKYKYSRIPLIKHGWDSRAHRSRDRKIGKEWGIGRWWQRGHCFKLWDLVILITALSPLDPSHFSVRMKRSPWGAGLNWMD